MAKILREGLHAAEFIVWETDSNYCRTNVALPTTAGFGAGSPFLVNADGDYEAIDADNVDDLLPTVVGEDTVPPVATFGGFAVWPQDASEEADTTALHAIVFRGPAILNESLISWPLGASDAATAVIKGKIKGVVDPQIEFES